VDLLLAFLIGWAAGAKGGEQGFQDVLEAARELRRSEEFRALLDALRAHLAGTLRALADVLSEPEPSLNVRSLVERATRLQGSARSTPSAS
jgi:hypothetical protein